MNINKIKPGVYVYYVSVGICEVKAVENVNGQEHYVLETINEKDSCKLFIPTNNEVMVGRIHHILTKEEIDAVLNDYKEDLVVWNSNRKERTEQFTSIIRSYDFVQILGMVRCLYVKSNELKNEKKRLSTFDSDILKKAQNIIDEMLSFSLKIPRQEVGDYIRSSINNGLTF